MKAIQSIRREIAEHPTNHWAKEKGWIPIFTAHKNARISIIGQAPGIRAQTSEIPWDDASGKTLRSWLGVSDETFYNPKQIALIPMDFYFPGKGKTGDLPPRKDFAKMWHEPLFELMPNIQLNILIGQYAQAYYLGDKKSKTLTETVQNYKTYLKDGFLPLPHPSPRNNIWMAKNPWFSESVLPKLKSIVSDLL